MAAAPGLDAALGSDVSATAVVMWHAESGGELVGFGERLPYVPLAGGAARRLAAYYSVHGEGAGGLDLKTGEFRIPISGRYSFEGCHRQHMRLRPVVPPGAEGAGAVEASFSIRVVRPDGHVWVARRDALLVTPPPPPPPVTNVELALNLRVAVMASFEVGERVWLETSCSRPVEVAQGPFLFKGTLLSSK